MQSMQSYECVCVSVWSHLPDKNCSMHRHKLSLYSSHSTQEMCVCEYFISCLLFWVIANSFVTFSAPLALSLSFRVPQPVPVLMYIDKKDAAECQRRLRGEGGNGRARKGSKDVEKRAGETIQGA